MAFFTPHEAICKFTRHVFDGAFYTQTKALSASSYVLEAGEQRCLVAIIDKSMPSCGYPYDGSGHGSGNTELRESLDDRIL